MNRHQQESFIAVHRAQKRMRRQPGAKIFTAALDESNGVFPTGQEVLNGIRQGGEASGWSHCFRGRDRVRSIRTSGRDGGFPLFVDHAHLRMCRLGDLRKQEILGNSHVLRTFQGRPSTGAWAPRGKVLGYGTQSIQKGFPAAVERLQDPDLLVCLHVHVQGYQYAWRRSLGLCERRQGRPLDQAADKHVIQEEQLYRGVQRFMQAARG